MFLSGVEIDIEDFRQERKRSLFFGILTFTIPFLMGLGAAFLLQMSLLSSVLFASLFASHTLITWPVVSRYGVQHDPSASVSVGATVFAVTGAMIILAIVSSIAETNVSEITALILRMGIGGLVMVFVIFALMPRLARWFFYRYNDSVAEWLFVMFLAISGGALAWLANFEPILGVFLTALALNKHIPHLSPLMNRINFVGNAAFIPIFLIGVGMMIDLRLFLRGGSVIIMSVVMVVIALSSKWLATFAAQHIFHFSGTQRRMMYGLTNAHAAGALAIATIGFSVTLSDGSRLLSEEVLNGTILMILFSCIVASFLTEHAAKQISNASPAAAGDTHALSAADATQGAADEMQILIPIANPDTNKHLITLATILLNKHPESHLHAATVTRSYEEQAQAEKVLKDAARYAAATDHNIMLHRQVAVNIPNGIRTVAKERRITHIVMGLPIGKEKENAYGKIIGPLIALAGQQIWLYHASLPISDIHGIRILMPPKAEQEKGYNGWQKTMERLVQTIGCEVTQETITSWNILPRILANLSGKELLVIVQARRSTISYSAEMEDVPQMVRGNFKNKNIIVLFPFQQVEDEEDNALLNEYALSGESTYSFIHRLTK